MVWNEIQVSRSIHFPALLLLSLFALVLLLSGQLSRLSVPRAMPESWRAIDRAALEEVTLANQQPATKRDLQPVPSSKSIEDRSVLSGVGWFPNPDELKGPMSGQRGYSSLSGGINQVAEKQGGESSRSKSQMKSTGYRPRVKVLAHNHGPRFFERRFGHPGNDLSWQKIRSDIQRLKKRITRWFRPTWRRGGRYALSQ
jgi:hypothetical protein